MADEDQKEKERTEGAQDMDRLLAERDKLDHMFRDKFTKVITVMFTDLKGSTALADRQGDVVSRLLVKHYQEIIIPAVQDNNGVFVKSIGDGTLSYFDQAQDALHAAVRIQKGIDAFIVREKPQTPVLARVGMHTGRCIVEQSDIFGDVVNTASRFESIADPGGIALSEDTYNALTDKEEITCRFVKTTNLKGKQEAFKIYKAFWNCDELEMPVPAGTTVVAGGAQAQRVMSPARKLLLLAVAIVALILIVIAGKKIMHDIRVSQEKRSIRQSVDAPLPPR